MNKNKLFIASLVFFMFFRLYAFEKEGSCEPSLVFPEIFMIESHETFSYTLSGLLHEDTKALFSYLNSVSFSQEQFPSRYLYYLRTRQFLPALSLLMAMVNLEIYTDSFGKPYDEFFNLLQMAANEINENPDENNGFSLENAEIPQDRKEHVKSMIFGNNDGKPLDSKALSDMLTAEIVLNFATINMRNKMQGRETVISQKIVFYILSSSFRFIFSNLERGVDLDEDPFFKEFFNTMVSMSKDGNYIMDSFVNNFLNQIYGTGNELGLYRYVLLRNFGMTKNAGDGWLELKDIKTAVGWIEATKKEKDLQAFSSYFVKDEKSCGFLSEKLNWISGMKHLGSESRNNIIRDMKISMMLEQCGDLDYLGLERKSPGSAAEGDGPYPEWALYLSAALRKVMTSEMNEKEAVRTLEMGLFAAIFTIRPTGNESWESIYELMMFIYRHKERKKVLATIFQKQITHGNLDKDIDSYREALKNLDNFLYN